MPVELRAFIALLVPSPSRDDDEGEVDENGDGIEVDHLLTTRANALA